MKTATNSPSNFPLFYVICESLHDPGADVFYLERPFASPEEAHRHAKRLREEFRKERVRVVRVSGEVVPHAP